MNILGYIYKKTVKLFLNTKIQVFLVFVILIIISLRHIKFDLLNNVKNFSIQNIQNNVINAIIKDNPQIINELTENNFQRRSNNLDIVQMGDDVKIDIMILNLENQHQQSQHILDYVKIGNNSVLTEYLINKRIGDEVLVFLDEIAKQSKDSIMRRFDNSKIFYKIKILSINEKK